jgi:RNA-directed DNA polymerase
MLIEPCWFLKKYNMKTHKNLFQEVCEFKNLYNAYLKARKGKNNIAEVLEFTYNLENELLKLQYELRSQTYKTGKYRHFIIFEPKERKISALPFRDRVVHHAICSVIGQIFEKRFIYDSYACRKGKGTHAGVDRIQKFIRKVNSNYYVLKCDVSKYFPSVNHEILKQLIREKIADKKLLQLLDKIIDSSKEQETQSYTDQKVNINFQVEDKIPALSFSSVSSPKKSFEGFADLQKGIPIGNLTSQLFANIYLTKLDEYIKYELKIKYYIRYMDDFIILHESKQELHEVKEKIILFFASIKLTQHPKKANIFPIALGVDFLGYRIFNNYKLVRKSTVKRFLKNVKGKLKKYDSGIMIFDKLMESFNSWESYMDYGNSYNLKKSLQEEYFKNVI